MLKYLKDSKLKKLYIDSITHYYIEEWILTGLIYNFSTDYIQINTYFTRKLI